MVLRVCQLTTPNPSYLFVVAATVVASLGLDPSKDQGIGVVFQKDNTPTLPNGTENGTWDIKFMTKFSGEYTLLVFHNAKPIKGCPVTINSKIENSQAVGQGAQKVTLCSDVEQDAAVIATSPRTPTSGKFIFFYFLYFYL